MYFNGGVLFLHRRCGKLAIESVRINLDGFLKLLQRGLFLVHEPESHSATPVGSRQARDKFRIAHFARSNDCGAGLILLSQHCQGLRPIGPHVGEIVPVQISRSQVALLQLQGIIH